MAVLHHQDFDADHGFANHSSPHVYKSAHRAPTPVSSAAPFTTTTTFSSSTVSSRASLIESNNYALPDFCPDCNPQPYNRHMHRQLQLCTRSGM